MVILCMGKTESITIYDVAGLAKVSMATVSRVLNNPEKVNEKTRERVMKIINELGFKPNPIARNLAAKKTATTIYIIVSNITCTLAPQIISGILDSAEELNYSIKISTISKKKNLQEFLECILTEKFDGIIYINDETNLIKQEYVESIFNTSKIPFVIIDTFNESSEISSYKKGSNAVSFLLNNI